MKKEGKNNVSRRAFVGSTAKALAGFMILPRYVLGGKSQTGLLYTAPSDMINLGLIGGGKQGKILSSYFLKTEQVRFVALSEVYKAKADLTLKQIKDTYVKMPQLGNYADIAVYNDFRELLGRKDVDAVVIAAPDHWHAAMAVRAAEAGKDIYCEKPMALTVKEGRAMVNAARKYNRVFQTGSMQRSWHEFRQTAELVRNGYIGQIKSIKVNVGPPPKPYDLPAEPIPDGLDWSKWLGPNEVPSVFNAELAPPVTKDVYPNWRNYREFGGGMVTDWGAHMFDIAQWAMDMDGSGPIMVTPPDKDHQFLTYQYASGITMTHEPADTQGVTFNGSKGSIHVMRRKLETTPETLKDKIIGANEKHVYLSENHYKDFLQAMRNRTKPVADVEIGHRTATVCNIGNIAYDLKRPLRWNPEKEEFINDDEANKLTGREMRKEWVV